MTRSSIVPSCALLISLHNKTPSLILSKTSLELGSIGKYFLQMGSSAKELLMTLTYAVLSSSEKV